MTAINIKNISISNENLESIQNEQLYAIKI